MIIIQRKVNQRTNHKMSKILSRRRKRTSMRKNSNMETKHHLEKRKERKKMSTLMRMNTLKTKVKRWILISSMKNLKKLKSRMKSLPHLRFQKTFKEQVMIDSTWQMKRKIMALKMAILEKEKMRTMMLKTTFLL
jgi:hypothetical protein